MAASTPEPTAFDRFVSERKARNPELAKMMAEERELIDRVDAVVNALRSLLERAGIPLAEFARGLRETPARLAVMERLVATAERALVKSSGEPGRIARGARKARAYVQKRAPAASPPARR